MDMQHLYRIIQDCVTQYRDGESVVKTTAVSETVQVCEVNTSPHISEMPESVTKVDLHFFTAGVDMEKAESHRDEFVALLDEYPDPDTLATGPSYIALGADLGDQGMALCFMALGKALGLWNVITPAFFGMTGTEADNAAGNGFVMITGYSIPDDAG